MLYLEPVAYICPWQNLASARNRTLSLVIIFSRITSDAGQSGMKLADSYKKNCKDLGLSLQQALNIFLKTLFQATDNRLSVYAVIDQTSQPYKTEARQ